MVASTHRNPHYRICLWTGIPDPGSSGCCSIHIFSHTDFVGPVVVEGLRGEKSVPKKISESVVYQFKHKSKTT